MPKPIELSVLTSPGCQICKAFKAFWETEKASWPNVNFREVDMTTEEGQALIQKFMIFASPGIIINSELFATGGFDRKKFLEKLKELSQ